MENIAQISKGGKKRVDKKGGKKSADKGRIKRAEKILFYLPAEPAAIVDKLDKTSTNQTN